MQMHTKTLAPIFAMLSVGITAPAAANLKPGSFMSKDGAEITPTLQTGLSSNNNFFSTPDNEESRLIWTITPNIKAAIDDGPDSYSLDLGTSSSLHNKDTADNFTQVNIGAGVHKEFTSQHRLDINGDADWLYEPRGSGLTEGLGDAVNELVKYQQQNVLVRYVYGAQSSKAQVALSAGFFSKKYQNFREVSQYRDYDKSLIGVTGYYNTRASTRTFLEVKQENYRYDFLANSGMSRDSDDVKVLLGMEWEATAVTSGSFKLGYQNKDFSANERQNFSGLSWEAGVNWQPLSYSTVLFTTSRAAKDPLVQGDYIKESTYGVNWTHNWSDYLSSLVGATYTNEQYTGDVGRKDKSKSARLGLNYVASKFGMVSTYVDFIDKDSTQSAIEFDRVIVGVNFTFALKAN
ncbi:outer membrane beta-barrel protein [Pseudoalteromonas sp. SR43-6]|uniref:outer membrane beta-barrel protein n=1 Tax=unclassified Pseudoalteromonas TaxID=194690 RepID=UPI0015FB3D65|nr:MULTISPECIES: outer membrane beta-barrel protein [unclassified Pseudoalteromonas]MBB1288049.1 outer membrane beta-barrel protein [Pseudoalteromonas sp. SR41-5]MBB1372821.1 outer membrane beta-barrel protein [Pseudoalteromonas sp. SR43-6]MBB1412690.1 outer membrane beta-barrel protein [Pseudoalteromonas sp. SG43-8]